jgi:hypothetical protein
MHRLLPIILTGMIFLFASCKPKIYSFQAEPSAVSNADSVRLQWKIRGRPTMMYDRVSMANPGGDSLQLLEFTLVAEKGNNDPAHAKRQIILLPEACKTILYVRMDSLSKNGDSLIAIGINDTIRWNDVVIADLSNTAFRQLMISHAGRSGVLEDGAMHDAGWKDLPYGGNWEIKSPLTEMEKKDHSKIPTRIELQVIIKPGKN